MTFLGRYRKYTVTSRLTQIMNRARAPGQRWWKLMGKKILYLEVVTPLWSSLLCIASILRSIIMRRETEEKELVSSKLLQDLISQNGSLENGLSTRVISREEASEMGKCLESSRTTPACSARDRIRIQVWNLLNN